MTCECLEKCPFFNDQIVNKPATAELMKKQYCNENFEACARYTLFKSAGQEHVPADLYPNQNDRASNILQHLQA